MAARVIPKIDDRLRGLMAKLATDPAEIVERIYRLLVQSDGGYSQLGEAAGRDVQHHIEFSVSLWFRTLLAGEAPNASDLAIGADCARRRVHQGVALSSMLHAFRLGASELWQSVLALAQDEADIRDTLLFQISPYLLDHVDRMAQHATDTYLDEYAKRDHWRDALRYELTSIIFSLPGECDAFIRTCRALGFDPAGARVALALDVAPIDVLPSRLNGELDRIVLLLARHWKFDTARLLWARHRGRLIVWLPSDRGDSAVVTDRHVLANARALTKAVPDIRAIGIGLMNHAACGWAASAEEAIKALDYGVHVCTNEPVGVFPYSEVAVSESVLGSRSVLRYLESLLERLAQEQELLTTLATYFQQGLHRKRTASALGIHPNTLNYRLDRIQMILGARLDDSSWLSRLDVAIKLRYMHLSLPEHHRLTKPV